VAHAGHECRARELGRLALALHGGQDRTMASAMLLLRLYHFSPTDTTYTAD
jgi:hypothetical protein